MLGRRLSGRGSLGDQGPVGRLWAERGLAGLAFARAVFLHELLGRLEHGDAAAAARRLARLARLPSVRPRRGARHRGVARFLRWLACASRMKITCRRATLLQSSEFQEATTRALQVGHARRRTHVSPRDSPACASAHQRPARRARLGADAMH